MKIAIIVVTMGRSAYLTELLESLVPQLDQDSPVLIVDNGSTDGTAAVIERWIQGQTTPVHAARVEVNAIDTRQWLELAQEAFGCDWVTFPGDDDRFLPGHLADLRAAIADNPEAVCVAAGTQDMDPSGTLQAGTTIPKPEAMRSRAALIGRLISRPEFAWPSFAFRSSVLEGALPALRFTFDWWAQLNCLLAGPAAATGRASVAYRRHPQQESQMWSTRRKYAEASWMLHGVLTGTRMSEFAKSASPAELDELLDALATAGGAVYGDPIFGLPPTMAAVTAAQGAGSAIRATLPLMRQSAQMLGLQPADAVLASWAGALPEAGLSNQTSSTLAVESSGRLCPRAVAIAKAAHVSTVAGATVTIACEHDSTAAQSRRIRILCTSASSDAELCSALRDQVQARLEDEASIASGLQPMERRMLAAYRSAGSRVPHRVRALLKRAAK